MKTNKLFAVIVVLAIALSLVCTALTAENRLSAAADPGWFTGSISVAQLTDTHYYPIQFVDEGGDAFANGSKSDAKLLTESGAALDAALDMVAEELPDYLFVTGDLTSNGELAGHIYVANTLRTFQRRIRRISGHENFQIYVVPGNHDLYNGSAVSYASGAEKKVATVDLQQFYYIYRGLGFADVEAGEVADNAAFSVLNYNAALDYMPGSVVYQQTFDELGEDECGGLSYIAYPNEYTTIACFDSTIHEADSTAQFGYEHITAGELTENTLDWALPRLTAEYAAHDTIFSMSHHNLLPHFTYEEVYTTDFVLNNWEDAAFALADAGARYHFSGHQHASDVARFASYAGNVIYDFQTSSIISNAAAMRTFGVVRQSISGKLCEDANTRIELVEAIDFMDSEGNLIDDYQDYV